jgi:hypothetical protein
MKLVYGIIIKDAWQLKIIFAWSQELARAQVQERVQERVRNRVRDLLSWMLFLGIHYRTLKMMRIHQ